MDCHRCIHVRYGGCRYGRCSHPGHSDVILSKGKSGEQRRYNRQICKDFVLKKRCSNCRYWERGEYFSDGMTPARRGSCSLKCEERGKDCPIWRQGETSWHKRSG